MRCNRCSFALTVAALICAFRGGAAFQEATKYLIVSSPVTHQVGYVMLNNRKGFLEPVNMRLLIGEGLTYPQGLAVDNYRRKLYVADPQRNGLVGYDLHMNGDALEARNEALVVDGIETRWVTVDGVGNVYFSDEVNNRILRISADEMESHNFAAIEVAEVVYDQTSVGASVTSPGGVAVDDFSVYWTNKADGTVAGVLLQGQEIPEPSSVRPLATNSPKCYGVCTGINTIFFTDETNNVYATRRGSGEVVTVADTFTEARGCTNDGEGNIYVADKGQNAVFAIPTNTPNSLANLPVSKVVDMQGAYGTAVFVDLSEQID